MSIFGISICTIADNICYTTAIIISHFNSLDKIDSLVVVALVRPRIGRTPTAKSCRPLITRNFCPISVVLIWVYKYEVGSGKYIKAGWYFLPLRLTYLRSPFGSIQVSFRSLSPASSPTQLGQQTSVFGWIPLAYIKIGHRYQPSLSSLGNHSPPLFGPALYSSLILSSLKYIPGNINQ